MQWFDVVGSAGAAMILLAYALLQLGRLSNERLSYSLLNGFGAMLILVSLTQSFNLAAFIIEAFWVLISLVGIVRWLHSRRESRQ